MNRILSRDSLNRSGSSLTGGNLKTKTYNVIPMSVDIGILEWVMNSAPLKGILVEESQRLGLDADGKTSMDKAYE